MKGLKAKKVMGYIFVCSILKSLKLKWKTLLKRKVLQGVFKNKSKI